MLAFLGAVAKDDLDKGKTDPSYYLCKHATTDENDLGYMIVAANTQLSNVPKVLVNSFVGNEDLIEFMSRFRSVKYPKNRKGRIRYFVQGALFWFPCNRYGERIPQQPPVFITRIPLGERVHEEGAKRLRQVRENRNHTINHLLSDEPVSIVPSTFNVKRKMPDSKYWIRRMMKNDENERENAKPRERRYPEIGKVGF